MPPGARSMRLRNFFVSMPRLLSKRQPVPKEAGGAGGGAIEGGVGGRRCRRRCCWRACAAPTAASSGTSRLLLPHGVPLGKQLAACAGPAVPRFPPASGAGRARTGPVVVGGAREPPRGLALAQPRGRLPVKVIVAVIRAPHRCWACWGEQCAVGWALIRLGPAAAGPHAGALSWPVIQELPECSGPCKRRPGEPHAEACIDGGTRCSGTLRLSQLPPRRVGAVRT